MTIKNKNILSLPGPAREWRDAWPVGNGVVGALVPGDPGNEGIILNHEDCWLYGRTMDLPDVSESLQKVRDLMAHGEFQSAHDHYRDRLRNNGYTPHMANYSPVSVLRLIQHLSDDIEGYSRSLDMGSGETGVIWKCGDDEYRRTLFVSRSDGLVHFRLQYPEAGSRNLSLGLEPLNGEADEEWLVSNRLELTRENRDNKLILALSNESGRTCTTELKVLSCDGDITSDGGQLHIADAEDIHIVLRITVDSGRSGAETEDSDGFELPESGNYTASLQAHRKIHSDLYKRITLNLAGESATSVQTMFDYGRYLMIASSGGGLPPNLQGLWNGDLLPIWNCFFMLNENIQMMHWQALPGGTPEFLFPMFEYYETRMDDFRENARKLFGCRGIFIPANTVPDTGLLTDLQGHLIHWTAGAAWLARFYFDYYLYTEDRKFLKERALPLMREAALFFEDYLYENQQGKLEFCPSVSPENAPEEFNREFRMDAMCNVTVNATMDVALCRELLTNLVSAAGICGTDGAEVNAWESMKAKLPEYSINEDGAISEWLHDDFSDNYHHRHQSHIYPFFPGSEIRPGDDMIPAIETAVEKRLQIGLKEQTGWSVVHLANIYARLGCGDRALECLEILRDYCTGENLFTYHNDWRERGVCEAKPRNFDKRVFQIDANLGYPAAVMEMLCYSMPGLVSLLPGLPADLPEGEVSGLKCRGGIGLDMRWSPGLIELTLESTTDQEVGLRFPSEPDSIMVDGSAYEGPMADVRVSLAAGTPMIIKARLSGT